VILREKGEEEALLAVAAMQQGTVVDLDSDLALESAGFGIQEKLAFADSVIYTVAQRYSALIWTQDAHFEGKSNVRYEPKSKTG
jgi:predicted nucleic acid-binding protein